MTVANVQILLKRGNTTASSAYTGPLGELTMDTTLKGIRIHDGVRAGGNLIVQNQLTNGANVVSLDSRGNVTFPTGAGIINGYPGADGSVGDGQSWFVTSSTIGGGVASPDGKNYVQVDNGGLYIGTNFTANTGNTWVFGQNGVMSLPYSNYIQTIDTNMTIGTQGGFTFISNAAGGATNYNLTFGQNGTTTFPGLITTTGNITTTRIVKTGVYTVSSLPTASSAGAGARAFVTDANTVVFGSALTGGAGNAVPVFSNGTTWRIG